MSGNRPTQKELSTCDADIVTRALFLLFGLELSLNNGSGHTKFLFLLSYVYSGGKAPYKITSQTSQEFLTSRDEVGEMVR